MAKVEGSNPFIRFHRNPRIYGGFVRSRVMRRPRHVPWVAAVGSKRGLAVTDTASVEGLERARIMAQRSTLAGTQGIAAGNPRRPHAAMRGVRTDFLSGSRALSQADPLEARDRVAALAGRTGGMRPRSVAFPPTPRCPRIPEPWKRGPRSSSRQLPPVHEPDPIADAVGAVVNVLRTEADAKMATKARIHKMYGDATCCSRTSLSPQE